MILARSYETIMIAKPDFDEEAVDKLHKRLLKVIDTEGGLELSLVDWGRRRLAYPIDNHRKGNYFYFGYIANPVCIAEMHRQIRLSPEIIRYQTVTLSPNQPVAKFDIAAERERVVALTPDVQEEDDRERRDRRENTERRFGAAAGRCGEGPRDARLDRERE